MSRIVVVFDFDKTIVDVDSDNWVVDELGFTDLFNQLLPTMPWNTLMVSLFVLTCFKCNLPCVFYSSIRIIICSEKLHFLVFKGYNDDGASFTWSNH